MSDILRITKLSPKIAFSKVFRKLKDYIDDFRQYRFDSTKGSYLQKPEWLDSLPFQFLSIPDAAFLDHYKEMLANSAALTCTHQFDLLGSGVVKVGYVIKPQGYEDYAYHGKNNFKSIHHLISDINNISNKNRAFEYSKLLPDDYQPIDWQIDFRSGFRWSENTWSKHIKYGDVLGADIKVPWELGRMQHLLTLSLAYAVAKKNKITAKAEYYFNEFCNQIVDFYISNPPKFGTQWMSTMDVAIRAVNLIVARSFFLQSDAKFSNEFEDLFKNLLADHYYFVKDNLEWSSGMRGNHFLAGLSGLIIISAHLPSCEETNETLSKTANQLINEIFYQFHDDGGNFEGSLSYHRFSFEMISYGLFTFLSLPKIRLANLASLENKHLRISNEGVFHFSSELIVRLFKIFKFQLFATSKSQYLPQIGDNDSGYFLRLSPFYLQYVNQKVVQKDHFFYNANNSWNILAFFAGYFNDMLDDKFYERYLEYYVGKSLRNRSHIDFEQAPLNAMIIDIHNYLLEKTDSSYFRAKAFQEFGLYSVWRNKYNFVMHCGKIGQRGKGGHDHNDQLSFELMIEEVPIIVNAGTYCYTPIPEQRNRYRSVNSANTLVFPGIEQNKWQTRKKDDLFWLEGDSTKSDMREFSDKGLIAEHYAYKFKHVRKVVFESNEIKFIDHCERPGFRRVLIHFIPGVEIAITDDYCLCAYMHLIIKIPNEGYKYDIEDYQYSSHYGLLQNSKRLVISSNDTDIKWTIRVS